MIARLFPVVASRLFFQRRNAPKGSPLSPSVLESAVDAEKRFDALLDFFARYPGTARTGVLHLDTHRRCLSMRSSAGRTGLRL